MVGFGEGEMYVASDMPAILEHTRQMVFLESGQIAGPVSVPSVRSGGNLQTAAS